MFVQSNSLTAGLTEGTADVAVLRKPIDDARFETALLGTELRYGVVATDNPLARKRSLKLADLARYAMAIDDRTGTTTLDLWQPGKAPAVVRNTHSVDEWLTLIAAGSGRRHDVGGHREPQPAPRRRLSGRGGRATDRRVARVVEGPAAAAPHRPDHAGVRRLSRLNTSCTTAINALAAATGKRQL